jgi:hypothetical protein
MALLHARTVARPPASRPPSLPYRHRTKPPVVTDPVAGPDLHCTLRCRLQAAAGVTGMAARERAPLWMAGTETGSVALPACARGEPGRAGQGDVVADHLLVRTFGVLAREGPPPRWRRGHRGRPGFSRRSWGAPRPSWSSRPCSACGRWKRRARSSVGGRCGTERGAGRGRSPAVASSDIPSSRGRLGDRNCPLRRGFRGAPAEFHARTRCCNRPLAAVEIASGTGCPEILRGASLGAAPLETASAGTGAAQPTLPPDLRCGVSDVGSPM